MRYKAALLVVAMFATGTAFAGTGGGQNMAGCGLGSMLFKDNNNTKGVQSTAATTNGIFDNQLFGITSGTLGCTGDTRGGSKDNDAHRSWQFSAVRYERCGHWPYRELPAVRVRRLSWSGANTVCSATYFGAGKFLAGRWYCFEF